MKKIPMRQCLGCREMLEKRSLIRVVKTPEGTVVLDPTGKRSGRGAYVCRKPGCLARAIKSRALERAFSTMIDPSLVEELKALLASEDEGSVSNGG